MNKRESKSPYIRFPEFKEGWEHKQLNELLKVSKKKNTDLKYSKEEVLSVSGELGIVNQIKHLGRSYAGVSVHNYGVVENGDIVYTKSPLKENPYGIIKLNKGIPGIVSTLYAVYKVKENNAIGEFIEHYFSLDANTNRYLRPLVRKGAKNDMKINNEYVLHDRVFVPKKEEQKRIARFFNIIEAKINQLKEKHSLLEDYKKGVMHKVFSQKIRFKNDDGSFFSDWEEMTLDKIGKTYNGLTGKSKENFGKGLPYIQYKQIFGNSSINLDECDYVEVDKDEKQNKVMVGDLFFTTSSETPYEIGLSSVLLDEPKEVYLNSFCFGFRIKSFQVLVPEFAQYLFRSNNVRKDIIKLGQGSTRYNMSKKEFLRISIQIPVVEEQIKIAIFFSRIDDKIQVVSNQIEDLKTYKKALLQQMFCY